MSKPTPPPDQKRAALSRELSAFLIELSTAVHKHAMYPEDHPLLPSAAEGVVRRAEQLLKDRASVSLGVARDQLIIDGVATESKHPVMAELARRLHRHHLGAVSISQGIEAPEMFSLLRALASEPERTGEPLGLGPRERLEAWQHARLHALTYDRLELVETATEELPAPQLRDSRLRSAQLWSGLARAALADQLPEDEAPLTPPGTIAEAIDANSRNEAYDQVIVGYMLEIGEELRDAEDDGAQELRRRASELVRDLKPQTLRRLVRMGGDSAQRRQFVRVAAGGMAADAVVEVLKAAAEVSDQQISHSMVRLLTKLAAHAERGPQPGKAYADTGLRDQVRRLLMGWELDDPNPSAYSGALQRIATVSQAVVMPDIRRHAPEDERLVQMGLEVDTAGPRVRLAAERLAEAGRLVSVLDIIDSRPTGSTNARDALAGVVADEDAVAKVLAHEPVDMPLLERLLQLAGATAANPLLDALANTESRSLRRQIVDRLRQLGPAIAPTVIARLNDQRWYVVRNLLVLLDDYPELPPDLPLASFATNPDARVRRLSMKLRIKIPQERDRAIAAALADEDPQVVHLGLISVQREASPANRQRIENLAADRELSSELRVLAIRALGESRSPTTLELLLGLVVGGRTLLGKARLAKKSPEVLAAISVLAGHWSSDTAAAELVAVAMTSGDPEIRTAAGRP